MCMGWLHSQKRLFKLCPYLSQAFPQEVGLIKSMSRVDIGKPKILGSPDAKKQPHGNRFLLGNQSLEKYIDKLLRERLYNFKYLQTKKIRWEQQEVGETNKKVKLFLLVRDCIEPGW